MKKFRGWKQERKGDESHYDRFGCYGAAADSAAPFTEFRRKQELNLQFKNFSNATYKKSVASESTGVKFQ
jgi:hypothetical protein